MTGRDRRLRGGKRRGTGASLPKTKYRDEWLLRNGDNRSSRRVRRIVNLPTSAQLREFLERLSEATGDPMVADFLALMDNYGLLDVRKPSRRLSELYEAIFGGHKQALQHVAHWYRARGMPESTIVQRTAFHDYEADGPDQAIVNTRRALDRKLPAAPDGNVGTVFVRPIASALKIKMHPTENRPIRSEGETVANTRDIRRRILDGSLVTGIGNFN